MSPPSSSEAEPADERSDPAIPPDLRAFPQARPAPGLLGLDRPGLTQTLGGLAVGLIALFSSYDPLSFAGHRIDLQQQWGVVCIAASLATVVVDAQLASRSRFRDATARLEAGQRADREQDLANQEGERAAEARERQAESLQRLDQTTLLCARLLADSSDDTRERLRDYLTLREQRLDAPP